MVNVSPHSPPFSKIVASTSDEIDGPWIVTHIGQDGMVDDWWQSAPGKIAAPPTLRWESGGGECDYLCGKYGIHVYILPIKVETGRFTQIPQEFRLCILCDSNSVEDERHFLFECSFYEDIRNTFFHTENLHSEFNTLNYENRFKLLMSIDVVKLTANLCVHNLQEKERFHLQLRLLYVQHQVIS